MMIKKLALCAGIVFGCALVGIPIAIDKCVVKASPAPQAQKFRFGELCPDGLKVEYISTIRLPKSVVCQKPVG